MSNVALSLAEASSIAPRTDAIFFTLVAVSTVVVILVAGTLAFFSWRYRRDQPRPRGPVPAFLSREIEIGWTLATVFAFFIIFWWGASQDFEILRPPPSNALQVHVVAKQWMWKTEQPGGQREIDAVHLPVGRPVTLIMNSQDVIHSFYVPAFRIKRDIVPGRTEQMWFIPTKIGDFSLFCTEFCGVDHSAMRGRITVMSAPDYARWLVAQPQGDDLAEEGGAIFRNLGCAGCHDPASHVHAPSLEGLYGAAVPLDDGRFVKADDVYMRDSILEPRKDVVAGYDPVMPSYSGRVSEGDLVALVAYLRSLARGGKS